MSILSNLANLPDLSMRQMVFFYELCKMGAVRFDLSNPQHKSVFEQKGLLVPKIVFDSGHRKYSVEQIEVFVKELEQLC